MKKISIIILVAFTLITSCSKNGTSNTEKSAAPSATAVSQADAEKKYELEAQHQMDEEFKNPKQPVVKDTDNFKGNKNAPITIVTYSDFECSFCSRAHGIVEELLKKYDGKIRYTFKNLPLTSIHPYAMISAQYFEAITLQDKELAWKFHDTVFENQEILNEQGEAYVKSVAKNLGVDMNKLEEDVKSDAVKNKIKEDSAEAIKFGFRGTPAFLVNGVSLMGAQPVEEFSKIIDRHLSGKK